MLTSFEILRFFYAILLSTLFHENMNGFLKNQLLHFSRIILVKTNASLIEKFISSLKYQSNENTNVCLEEIKDCLENIFL